MSKTIDILAVIETWLRPQLPALLTFLLLVIPSIIDHVKLDEVVVLAFLYQNSSKLNYIRTMSTLALNPFLLTFQILLSPLISSVFIALQDTQPISLKNSRIYWKIWHLFIQNFIFLVNLIFIWTYLQQ